jgi:ubiquinone/menaquinone biosynthesis C-methylase UbiE
MLLIDSFTKSVLVDPLDKSPLQFFDNHVKSSYGRVYKYKNNCIDFRFLPYETTAEQNLWLHGQIDYEKWNKEKWIFNSRDVLVAERNTLNEIYESTEFGASVLDVGGGCGLLKHFLPQTTKYLIVDPYAKALTDIGRASELHAVYPFLKEPINFVCGDAEFLPIAKNTFDTVHMRSCIDHFSNPELALCEEYRVLKDDGWLIVGILEDSMIKTINLKSIASSIKNKLIGSIEDDHHTWHPSLDLIRLVLSNSGFQIINEKCQSGFDGRVIYFFCKKIQNFSRERLA